MADASVNVKVDVPIQDLTSIYLNLNRFRTENKFCDITIHVGEKSFVCNRNVLAAASEYFEKMFCGPFIESKTSEIALHDIDVNVFEEILVFIYTGKITITSQNVDKLLVTSEYLRLRYLENLCSAYVENKLPIHNVLEILAFACTTNKITLASIVCEYIAENFVRVSQLKKFLSVSFGVLRQILMHENLESNYDAIADFLIRWVKHNSDDTRKKFVPELVRIVELRNFLVTFTTKLLANEIHPAELKDEQESEDMNLDINDDGLLPFLSDKTSLEVLMLFESVEADSVSRRVSVYSIQNNKWNVTRSSFLPDEEAQFPLNLCKSVFWNTCKYSLIGSQYRLKFYTHLSNEWLELNAPPLSFGYECTFPSISEVNFNLAATDSMIYLCASMFEHSTRIYSYNCEINRWIPLDWNGELPRNACLVTLNNLLYVLGSPGVGYDKYKGSTYETHGFAQCFDPRLSKVITVPGMSHHHNEGAACVHNGKIYVSGGSNFSYYAKVVEVFDPVANKWEILAPMKQMRKCHSLVSYKNKLWAVGGSCNLNIDIYDPVNNTWSVMTSLSSEIQTQQAETADPCILNAIVCEL